MRNCFIVPLEYVYCSQKAKQIEFSNKNSVKINSNIEMKKYCIPLKTPVLLYKSGVRN